MNITTKKKVDESAAVPEAERRRIGLIVHDERGNASVSWRDAPDQHERPVLAIEGEAAPLSLHREERSYDPYSQARKPREAAKPVRGGTTRTDLRKLSEHIKMMRELEARKRNGEDEDV